MNGIILAGGKSLRFGEDKAFAKVRGSILIESLIASFSKLFDNTIIVTNYPEKYREYPVNVVVDETKGAGPLAGIYAGLKASDSEPNFVMACDMPFPQLQLIEYLMGRSGAEVVVPDRGGKIEPLFAVYSKRCLEVLKKHLENKRYKIQDAFSYLDVDYVREEEIKKYDPGFLSFLNLNTKKDLERIDECLKNLKSSVLI